METRSGARGRKPSGPRLERGVTEAILKALRARGGVWWKVAAGPWSPRGMPDIVGCYCGRFVGIEVKHPSRRHNTTALQRVALEAIRSAGGVAGVATSVPEALELLGLATEADSSGPRLRPEP